MKRLFIFGVLLCTFLSAAAQDSAPILNYTYNEVIVNPAYMGTYKSFTAGLSVRKQAMGIDGAPAAQRLQLGKPLADNKNCIGLLVTNDTYGVSGKLNLMGQYAYSLPLANGKLSFGLQAGVESFKEDNNELSLKDGEMGGLFANSGRAIGFNMGFGAFYSTDKYYVGLSAPQFFYNYFNGDQVKSQLFDEYMFRTYLAGGYYFDLANDMRVRPSILVCYQTSSAINSEFAVTGYYQDKFWAGAAYRTSKEAGFSLGAKIEKMFSVNYSFGIGVGQMQQKAGTSHEIGLRMILPYQESK